MSPRRKKEEMDLSADLSAGALAAAEALAKAEGAPVEGESPISDPPAKKKRVRAKKAAPEAPLPPARIKIEPEIRPIEAEDSSELWMPPKKGDTDLSVPPRVLLQRKKVPAPEVEDILEETDAEEAPEREIIRPAVRSGLFKKIAFGFGDLVLAMAALVGYVTIVVHPRRIEVRTERVLTVTAQPSGADEISGEVREISVAGEKSGAPSGSAVADAVATGFVTLINTTSEDQVLVATTRLLTPENVMFRLKTRVLVSARGRLKTEVYADKAGKAGEIGPSKFTIPGLNPELQKVIYAESDAPMTGGTIASGVASADDIAGIEGELKSELLKQAKDELAKRQDAAWTGESMLAETMSRFVSAAPGETTKNGVLVRLTLRDRTVGFDRAKALAAVVEDLKRGLTSDRELVSVKGDEAEVSVEKADLKSGTAMIRVALKGESSVSISSPLFDAEKLKGLSISAVKTYFDAVEGVERIDVKFRPFWIKRMPDLKDHIFFEIAK